MRHAHAHLHIMPHRCCGWSRVGGHHLLCAACRLRPSAIDRTCLHDRSHDKPTSSPQVIMDVLGVLITCTVAPLVFETAERIFA